MEGDHYHGDASPPLPRERKKIKFFSRENEQRKGSLGGGGKSGKKMILRQSLCKLSLSLWRNSHFFLVSSQNKVDGPREIDKIAVEM